jgi:hypothetical protein
MINNMDARGSYHHVWHLRRTYAYYKALGDEYTAKGILRMLAAWTEHYPEIAFPVYESYDNREGSAK